MTQRPQDLVFTLFGEYLLGRAQPVWVGGLIALLRPFGLSEAAVRTVLSRMARKGWLQATRKGRLAFYDLTPRGRALLEEGKARIYHPPQDVPWSGRWYLVSYSIPERVRHRRDRLRTRLAWLGFGSLGNGLWISPHEVGEEVAALARDLQIEENLECFRATLEGKRDPRTLVAHCWDLAAINERYRGFIARWQARLDACSREAEAGGIAEERAYVLRFRLIHEFRGFYMEDPFLPPELLPPDWEGRNAAALVEKLHALCEGPADAYVERILTRNSDDEPS
ncbi:MAG: PaaX family transcriptional regulator C-terminal domain-containing protein [Gemmatimonadota bacterium]